MTKRRGFFRGFTAAVKLGTLGSLAVCARPLDSNPSSKNEIEYCIDRLDPPPKVAIRNTASNVRFGGNVLQNSLLHCDNAIIESDWTVQRINVAHFRLDRKSTR